MGKCKREKTLPSSKWWQRTGPVCSYFLLKSQHVLTVTAANTNLSLSTPSFKSLWFYSLQVQSTATLDNAKRILLFFQSLQSSTVLHPYFPGCCIRKHQVGRGGPSSLQGCLVKTRHLTWWEKAGRAVRYYAEKRGEGFKADGGGERVEHVKGFAGTLTAAEDKTWRKCKYVIQKATW